MRSVVLSRLECGLENLLSEGADCFMDDLAIHRIGPIKQKDPA